MCEPAANLVGPAAASPASRRGASHRTGQSAFVALLAMPWKILASTQGYIFTWLVGYSALLGPVAGIMLVDYYFLRDTRLDVAELFAERGEYSYRGGWNPAAVIALACGVLPNLPGFLNAAFPDAFAGVPVFFKTLYTYAWFAGLAISAIVYAFLMRAARRAPAAIQASSA
jgi:NCS1 family nucleobase:cation symporter-1